MKRTLLALAVLLILAGSAFAQQYVSAPPPSDFRGMQWGTHIDNLPELAPVQEPGFDDTYFRRDESLKMDGAELVSVAYYFKDKRLYRVGVAYEGGTNHFFLKEALMKRYGNGRQVGARQGWVWPHFSVEIAYDSASDRGAVFYTWEGDPAKAPGAAK
jgi:hypothetical protein